MYFYKIAHTIRYGANKRIASEALIPSSLLRASGAGNAFIRVSLITIHYHYTRIVPARKFYSQTSAAAAARPDHDRPSRYGDVDGGGSGGAPLCPDHDRPSRSGRRKNMISRRALTDRIG